MRDDSDFVAERMMERATVGRFVIVVECRAEKRDSLPKRTRDRARRPARVVEAVGVEGSFTGAGIRSDHAAPTTIAESGAIAPDVNGHTLSHAVLQAATDIEEALKTGDLRRALDLVARLRALAA